jgi:hypothetical protein
MTPALNARRLVRRYLANILLAVALMLAGSAAQAQFIDRVEISRKGQEAEIRIRFAEQIQYLRHVPPEEGKILRVFIRLMHSNLHEGDLMTETLRSPKTDLVPAFSVTYPDLNDAILITFAQSTRFTVRPGTDSRSIIVTLPVLPGAQDFLVEQKAVEVERKPAAIAAAPVAPVAPAAVPAIAVKPAAQALPDLAAPAAAAAESKPASESAAPVMSSAEVEQMARNFMAEARQALDQKDAPKAVNRLNRVLGLPSNSQTQSAQAQIGEAREMNGELAKARAEYELYLKLFPAGAEAPSVKERLAKLPRVAATPRPTAAAAARDSKPAEWVTNASVSQYRYFGKSQIETLTPPPPGQLIFNIDTLSNTDQNSLISTLDINARRRDAFTDTRIVVRDTDLKNFIPGKASYNRLYSAYFEHTDREAGYFVRAGRQNPSGGGVLERFDGLSLGYNLNPSWRVNGVTGSSVEFLSPYKKNFYGVSVDLLAQPSQWGFSGYLLEQTLEGELNRRAIGGEARYFDSNATVYGMLDYDLVFKALNIALLQGNYLTESGDNYFVVVDHRKTPSYGLTNALPGSPGMSLKDILVAQGVSETRAQALALTAVSNMFSVGMTHPYSANWQFGADYRLASISGTEAAGAMPAQPGTGNSHVFSVQAIGNNFLWENAVGVANASLIKAPTYNGQAYGLNFVLPFWQAWRLDANLRYYTQKDNQDEKQERLSPTFKLTYRWKDQVSLEAEVGHEIVKVDGPLRVENAKRTYMFLGYRWDFR